MAQQVPGIDAILVGHAHEEIPERRVRNERTNGEVVLTEPLRWRMRLSLIDLKLVRAGHRWVVKHVGSSVLNSNTVAEDAHVKQLLQFGGGSFPGVTTAPVVYNAQAEIRQLIIDWVTAHGSIDPSAFAKVDWKLVWGGATVQITG